MVRLIIVIATVGVIFIAGLIIFIISWGGESSPISHDEESLPLLPVTVSINAIPWAKVFIKLPESDDFIEPRAEDYTRTPESNRTNVTPMRVRVPVDTTIRLVYEENEKIFPYEVWKDEKTISHDFLNQ